MLRIVRAIKKLYRRYPFDKAVRPRDDASSLAERAPREKDNLYPKKGIKAIPIRLLIPDLPSQEGLGVG
ncbi:hypothetical protein [Okeania sp. KiyG1]|uniref:hypothetical protein n=1 Tax=Okeania sp. KiyG1 TaxID=2720165 RepID=UPI001924E66F|nr:hypothetical protein [Okeania sp. KiyG1]